MDFNSLLGSFGYLFIFVCLFIECGILIGLVLPLPSLTLLVAAGVLAASGKLSLSGVIAVGLLAAVLGYIVGYGTGFKYGRKLFYERDNKKYFTRAQGEAAEKFMKRWGYSTLIIGRFLPVLHTLVPVLSGMTKMPFIPFMAVNVLGGFIFVTSTTLLGFFAGQSIPHAQYYLIPFIIVATIVANTPFGKQLLNKIVKRVEKM